MTAPLRVLGISGVAGSGKDTLADLLSNYGFVKMAFADPIKRAAAEWFDWPEEALWGPSELRSVPDPRFGGLTPRRALQFLGTEVGRALWPNVWVDLLLRRARRHLEEYPTFRGVVVSDVRFRNEVDLLRAAGAELVRVVRPGAGLSGAAAAHQSEAEMAGIPDEDFDVVLRNDGTLEDLRARAAELARDFSRRRPPAPPRPCPY